MSYLIRKSPDQRLFAPPRSLSQLITSFIACWHQGIHHVLLVACSILRLKNLKLLIKDSLHGGANRGSGYPANSAFEVAFSLPIYADVKEPFEALASNRYLKLVFPIQTIGKIQNANLAKHETGGPDRTRTYDPRLIKAVL